MPRRRYSQAATWPQAAANFAAFLPLERWEPAVRSALEATPADAPLAVAFSGGADSLAVLLSLWGAFPERRPALRVFHFNHRLRGAAATRDATFCANVCRELAVTFRAGHAQWPAGKKANEQDARDARWRFLTDEMTASGATLIFLGHQQDDVPETMLMRLARGSGGRGLSAPRPVQQVSDGSRRLRPLLGVAKAEIAAALRQAGAPWRTDATNAEGLFLRNRLRRSVVPAWRKAVAPIDLGAAVARSRELLEEEDAALEAWVDRVVPDSPAVSWDVCDWANLPRAIARRALHRWLLARGMGEFLSRPAVDALLAAIWQGRDLRSSAGAAGFVELIAGVLSVRPVVETGSKIPAAALLAVPGEWTAPDGGRVTATVLTRKSAGPELRRLRSRQTSTVAILGFDVQPEEPLVVRTWRSGDRYTPFGTNHVTKLQDQFVNRGISRARRHVLPIVVAPSGAILWVPGLPPAECIRVTARSRWLVQLTYHSAHPRSHLHDVR